MRALLSLCPNDEIVGVTKGQDAVMDSRFYSINLDVLANAHDPEIFKQLNEPDVCIHLAWEDGFDHRSVSHINSLPAHYAFLTHIIEGGCKNISVMGSMHEVGYHEGEVTENTPCAPMSAYGVAKNSLRQLMEICAGDSSVSLKWLRAFYIVGDDENSRSIFSKILKLEKDGYATFPFTDGKNKYDFIDVELLAKQIGLAALQEEVTGIINVCSGVPVSLREKIEQFLIERKLAIKPQYGAFPRRKYDSPVIWGNTDKISAIIAKSFLS